MTIGRWWAAAILFANGWLFALPVTDRVLPRWLQPVQVIHGVFLHEALLLGYFAFLFFARAGRLSLPPRGIWSTFCLIASLGILSVVSSVVNLRPLTEFVGAGRYFLLAGYFAAAVMWSRRFGPTFVLRNFLLGLALAGSFNLYYAFVLQIADLGGLPFLLGQNGPGGYLAVGVILGAWLMLERTGFADIAVAVFALVTGVFASSISYSKLAMLIAAAGLLAWVSVSWRLVLSRRARRWFALVVLLAVIAAFVERDAVIRYLRGVDTFITYKFREIDPGSIASRSQYFLITAEIMVTYPLGVGYGGFYDAAVATRAYKSERSAQESAEQGARGESNPHSSFLYYASANGVLGLFASLLLFAVLLIEMWRGFARRGVPARGLWLCLAGGYLLFGLTLPTLFNTAVMYLPAAVAIATAEAPTALRRSLRLHPKTAEA